MKFFSVLALLATAALVSAQVVNPCTTCLENSLETLPLCAGLNVTMGELDPEGNPALAACLCSALDGAWIDACTGAAQCGQDIVSFKSGFSDNIQGAGLSCGTTPSFVSSF